MKLQDEKHSSETRDEYLTKYKQNVLNSTQGMSRYTIIEP
jgi:hypothetical protein